VKKKYSVVIPVYNEKENIPLLVKEIILFLEGKFIYEIIIVNDFSNDGTNEILKSEIFSNCIVLNHDKNQGQSKSIRTGILSSSYENIITIDGDLQNNPKDIPSLINVFNKEDSKYDLIGGIRIKRKDNVIKKISSYLANSSRKFILNDNCDDTGCGLKIFKKKIFLQLPFFDGIHRFLPALFKGFGYSTHFIYVTHRARKSGQSKYGTINRLIWGIKDLIKVRKIIKYRKN
jgi:dolichol-phosphate mannosyltransferase